MGNMRVMVPVFMLLASIAAANTEPVLTCEDIGSNFNPCTMYYSPGQPPPELCCDGVRAVKKLSESITYGFTVCLCFRYAAMLMSHAEIESYASWAVGCGVDLPYKFDPSIHCTSVN